MSSENKSKHWHFKVIGYNKIVDKISGNVGDYTYISLLGTSEKDAIDNAKQILKKKYYRVQDIWECFEAHGFAAEMQMLQLEMQKKSLDTLKGMNHG